MVLAKQFSVKVPERSVWREVVLESRLGGSLIIPIIMPEITARRRECGVGESKVFLFGDWNVLGKR